MLFGLFHNVILFEKNNEFKTFMQCLYTGWFKIGDIPFKKL